MTGRRALVVVAAAVLLAAGVLVAVLALVRSAGGGADAAPPTSTVAPAPSTPSPTTSVGEPSPPGTSPSTSGPPAPDGLPQVTIETPTPGEHSRIPVHATGTAVAFEAVARYEVLHDGTVFVNGPLYADKGAPERGRWETDIELPIGDYTLRVFLESPEDGRRISSTEVSFHAG